MDSSTLVRTKPKIVPKITKIGNLVESADQIRKTSTKLRKVFEKGTYQKKTQLSILNRYKKRLESIQNQNDKRFAKKQRVKIKLPEIKKFAGNFFTAGAGDPLKTLGALAAFNALRKGAKGDILGALGPALVAAGIFFGPTVLGLGARAISKSFMKGKPSVGEGLNKPLWWERNPKSLGRANESYARYIAGEANIGDRARLVRRGLIPASGALTRGGTEALERQAKRPLAKQALGRFGKAIVPGVGAAFSFYSARERDKMGDKFGSAVDNISGSLSSFAAGVQIAAGAAAATGVGIPAAGLIELAATIAEVGSFSLDMFNLARDFTGQSDKEVERNKLKSQTEKQKALVEPGKKDSVLTFGKTLDGYQRVVDKFEEFSKSFKGPIKTSEEDSFDEGQARDQITTGEGPIQPSGQNVPTSPEGLPSLPPTGLLRGQNYGARRHYGGHTGQDFDISGNEKFYSRLGGEVIFAKNVGGEYGNVVEVYNKDLDRTEVIAEANNIMPNIREGMVISPGTPVVYGERTTASSGGSVGVVHYEIVKGVGGISNRNNKVQNPLQFLGSKEYLDYIKSKTNRPPQRSSESESSSHSVLEESKTYTIDVPSQTKRNISKDPGALGSQVIAIQLPQSPQSMPQQFSEIVSANIGNSSEDKGLNILEIMLFLATA